MVKKKRRRKRNNKDGGKKGESTKMRDTDGTPEHAWLPADLLLKRERERNEQGGWHGGRERGSKQTGGFVCKSRL